MVDSQSTPARQRPSIVSISSYLLFLFAALQVITLIISLSTFSKTRDAVREAYAGTADADQTADVFAAIGLVSGIVLLLLAVTLVVLALFNNRGRNGARITTWVVGGIMVCCLGSGLLGNAGGGFNTGGGTGDAPSTEEIQRHLEDALPSWVVPANLVLGALSLIALLTALILLALPKAHPFFRKATAAWEPPAPGASYPGAPQTPGQPGYPQSSGEPGYPSSGEPSYPPANRPDDTPPGSTPPSTS
ncbi:hypothetical protein [Micromonospora sp. DT231]|uniref:hypothetical protein n=1 Tax=Micromonospora sp. DT231 TaxID=3416526 RepID=UPI003CF014C8